MLRRSSLSQEGKSPRARAKKKAWEAFSRWIRLRDSDEQGICRCITCPKRAHWKDMDAGHYITRAKESVLFDPQNVHAQCGGCNQYQGGKALEYRVELIRRYGQWVVEKMEHTALMTCKRDVFDYQYIEVEAIKRTEAILAAHPQKAERPQ